MPLNGVAKLHFGAQACQTAGTVDVYGLQILDATLETGNTVEEEDSGLGPAAEAPTTSRWPPGKVLLEPTLTTLGNFLVRSNSQSSVTSASFTVRLPAGGLRHDPERLRLEHRAHLHADAGETLPVPAGHGLQLGDVRQRGRQRRRGRHRHLPRHSQGVWSTARLDFSAPPGGIAKLHFGAFGGSIPGLVQQSAGTLDLYSMQIRASAFEGESVSVTDLLADSLALTGSATLDGLTAQGNVGCDQLLCNDVNCTDVFTTGVDASGAVSCAALTATGTVAGFTATSGGVSTGSAVCGDVTSSGTVSAPQLFASNTLTVTNTSDFSDDLFLTKNWAGWSKLQVNSAAPDSGPELRLLGNQSARVFLERDGGIMINDEALVQTKSLSTQLSLTTNQRNPGCLVIAGNTGNVVCNTSFTNLSDSRVKTEMAEADVAELKQLFDSVEAKQYKRPDMNGDLRLGVNTEKEQAYWEDWDEAALRGIIQKQRKITETSKKLEMKKLYQVLIILDDLADMPQLHKANGALDTLFIRGRHMQISTWVSSQKLRLISVIEELSALLPKDKLHRIYEQATRDPYSFLFVYYLKPKNEMFYLRFEERFALEREADGSGAQLPGPEAVR